MRNGRISSATGGYSQARSGIPLKVVEGAVDHLNMSIEAIHAEWHWTEAPGPLVLAQPPLIPFRN